LPLDRVLYSRTRSFEVCPELNPEKCKYIYRLKTAIII
jgi:hypothetical protein